MKAMLTAEARNRLTVVLVSARNPQNIGATARAMQDFGFSDLRIVNEFGAPFEAAQLEAKSAVGAASVMQAAKRFETLPEAIADCTLVVGTTAIGGRGLKQPVVPLQAIAPTLVRELQIRSSLAPKAKGAHQPEDCSVPPPPDASSNRIDRIALLFGSEKTGLTNAQLSHCAQLLTIPLFAPEGRHLSMNLGQAVAVCLYELTREGFAGVRDLPTLAQVPVNSADRERLTTLLLQTMEDTGYARRFPANARVEVVRQLVHHLGTSREEAATWMGLLKSVLRDTER